MFHLFHGNAPCADHRHLFGCLRGVEQVIAPRNCVGLLKKRPQLFEPRGVPRQRSRLRWNGRVYRGHDRCAGLLIERL